MKSYDIGKLIKVAMAEKSFTQKMLADKLGVKQQMISQWINGQSNPKTSTLIKIAKALDIPLDYFEERKNLDDFDIRKEIEEMKKSFNKEIELLKKEIELIKNKYRV